MVKTVYRTLVPVWVRRGVDRVRRNFVFCRAMRRLQASGSAEEVSATVLLDLIYGWANGSWSTGPEYAQVCMEAGEQVDGPILECGSGLSTLLLGWATRHSGAEVWAFEHKEEWADQVRKELDKYDLNNVTIFTTPLRDYGNFVWYDPPLGDLPEDFGLVVCDGPPGDVKGHRYGVVPVMREHFAPNVLILMDDADREGERRVLDKWCRSEEGMYSIEGNEETFAKVWL